MIGEFQESNEGEELMLNIDLIQFIEFFNKADYDTDKEEMKEYCRVIEEEFQNWPAEEYKSFMKSMRTKKIQKLRSIVKKLRSLIPFPIDFTILQNKYQNLKETFEKQKKESEEILKTLDEEKKNNVIKEYKELVKLVLNLETDKDIKKQVVILEERKKDLIFIENQNISKEELLKFKIDSSSETQEKVKKYQNTIDEYQQKLLNYENIIKDIQQQIDSLNKQIEDSSSKEICLNSNTLNENDYLFLNSLEKDLEDSLSSISLLKEEIQKESHFFVLKNILSYYGVLKFKKFKEEMTELENEANFITNGFSQLQSSFDKNILNENQEVINKLKSIASKFNYSD